MTISLSESERSGGLASAFRDARVLVTGGLGFIGSHVATRLAELGAQVTVVDSLVPEYGGHLFNLHDSTGKIRVNISDVRDPYSMAHLIQGADYLFNLAGQTSHLDSMTEPDTDLQINCSSQLAILEICRRKNPQIKIVFASTRQVYGRPTYLPVDERHPCKPVDVNGINKLAGEQYHLLYNDVYGICTCVLRLTNTYGPRMRIRDARQTFLGPWIRAAITGAAFEVWGGEQRRDFSFVDDVVTALLLCAVGPVGGRIYNLGGPDPPITLKELANLVVECADRGTFHVVPFPEERSRIDIGDYFADFTSITSDLGWIPEVDLRSGLRTTIDFFRENMAHYVE